MSVASKPVLSADCGSGGIQQSIAQGSSAHPECTGFQGGGLPINYWTSNTKSWPAPYDAG